MDFQGFQALHWTQTPDELFDQLLSELGYAELKVLLVIIRQTFGWKKTEDDISLSQIIRKCGLSKKPVLAALRLLEKEGIINRERQRTPQGSFAPTRYRLRLAERPPRAETDATTTPELPLGGATPLGGRGSKSPKGVGGATPPYKRQNNVQTTTYDLVSEASDEAPDAAPTLSLQQQLEQLRDGTPPEHLALVDEFLGLCAAENKTGQIALSRRVNETRDLLKAREALGPDPWAYGMDAACRKEAPNINYVKAAAGSWGKQAATPSRDSPRVGQGNYVPPQSDADFEGADKRMHDAGFVVAGYSEHQAETEESEQDE